MLQRLTVLITEIRVLCGLWKFSMFWVSLSIIECDFDRVTRQMRAVNRVVNFDRLETWGVSLVRLRFIFFNFFEFSRFLLLALKLCIQFDLTVKPCPLDLP